MAKIVILGGGGHAVVVAETARAAGHEVLGHLAPEPAGAPALSRWLGDERAGLPGLPGGALLAPGLGYVNEASRAIFIRVLERALAQGAALARVIHPAAIVAGSAALGEGVFVGPGAIVNSNVRIGPGCIINTGAVVEHDSRLGAGCHLATRATLAGQVTLGDHTLIGAGAVVRQSVTIGERVIVGAGAAVVSDLESGCTALGVPARAVARA